MNTRTEQVRHALLIGLVVALALCGCQKVSDTEVAVDPLAGPPEVRIDEDATAPKGNGEIIGVSLLTKTHGFYQDLEAGMEEVAQELNYGLAVMSAEFKASEQDRQIDDFIVQKVAAIVVCPADSASVGGAISKANAAGIPVFTADIAADQGDVVSHIASDNKQGGRLIGEYLAKAIGGAGDVLIIDHPAVTSVQDRVAGFEEAIGEYPDITIVEKAPAEGQRGKAHDVTTNKLIQYPDLKGIFGINDDSALGALAACEATKGAEGIIIVGYDAIPEAQEKILKGAQLVADAVQFPERMGAATIETIARYLAGEDVPKSVPIEVDIVDRETLERNPGQ